MSVQTLIDIGLPIAFTQEYDLAFFASGYEERATFLARQTEPYRSHIHESAVLAFHELNDNPQRTENDRYYRDQWGSRWLNLSADDEGDLYAFLNETLPNKETLHLIVDYSSMSRLWYAGILNWARYAQGRREIVIDFFYSIGEYPDYSSPFIISDILAVPGCEGGAVSRSRLVALFGLGFDGSAALCVLDRVQPDDVIGFLAEPAASPEYPLRARKENEELIQRHATTTLGLPLHSVETTFTYLAELIAPHRAEADVVIIPMGPKPHVLAAILIAMRFEDVTCLRVSGKRQRAPIVRPTGAVVGTRLTLTNREANAATLSAPAS